MTEKRLVKEVEDFLTEVEWDDYKRGRIAYIIKTFLQNKKERVIVRHVYVDRVLHADATAATDKDLKRIAQEICEKHSIILEQLRVNSDIAFYPMDKDGVKKRRIQELVSARQDFAKSVIQEYPHTTTVLLASFLGYKDHSSIIHLLRYRKNVKTNHEGNVDT